MAKILSFFFNRVLNINSAELNHVSAAWFLTFVNKLGTVLGFTLLTVYFVSNYGVESLPVLFLLHAVGIMIGSLLFNNIVAKIRVEHCLLIFLLSTGFVLSFAPIVRGYSQFVFLLFMFLGLSVLMGQFKIIRMLFAESLFTPHQATRVFPVIESGETFGVILAGLLIASLSHYLSFEKFIYIWVLILMMAVPVIVLHSKRSVAIPFEELIEEKGNSDAYVDGHYFRRIKSLKNHKFIVGIVLIVLLQWSFVTVLEYQYTSAVENYSHSVELQSEAFINDNYGEDFAIDLGRLQILIGASALIFQLILASRLTDFVGTMGNFLLYPIVLIATVLTMIVSPGFASTLIARFSHEMTNTLHYNSYHASYYALHHRFRKGVMEFIEGFVRPMGAIVATTIIFIGSYYFADSSVFLNIIMLVALIALLGCTLLFRTRYEKLPKSDLVSSTSLNRLINALDLLEQNIKISDVHFLIDLLNSRKDLPHPVKHRIVNIFGKYGDLDTISYLIDEFDDLNDLKETVLSAINEIYVKFNNEIKLKPFTLSALKNLYVNQLQDESSIKVQAQVVKFLLLSNFYSAIMFDEVMSYLNKNMNESLLLACQDVFESLDDKHIASHMKKWVEHNDPQVRVSALSIISGRFDDNNVVNMIKSMISGSVQAEIVPALIYILKSQELSKFVKPVAMIRQKHLDNSLIKFLIDNILYIHAGNHVRLFHLYSKIDKSDMYDVYRTVKSVNNPKLSRYFMKRVEAEIHNEFMNYSRFGANLNHDSKVVFLKSLAELYKMSDNHKEYFLVNEALERVVC